jgi:hypothetical protein
METLRAEWDSSGAESTQEFRSMRSAVFDEGSSRIFREVNSVGAD